MSDKIQANFPTLRRAHKSWNIPAMPAMVVTIATESYSQSSSRSSEQFVFSTTKDPVKHNHDNERDHVKKDGLMYVIMMGL